jgi:hypothetical protein
MGPWIAVMFDRAGEWTTAFDVTGSVSLPGWIVAVVAALVIAACILEAIRGGPYGRSGPLVGAAVVFVVVLTGWWALDQLARRDFAAERRALDVRTFELASRALVPGSALSCLDAIAGEAIEDACDKALFATPEATAAAVSYVAAQLSLLASAREQTRSASSSPGIAALRRAVETDRFGIVAHVLAVRDRCTPDQCGAFFLLQDASRIRANLAAQEFESQVRRHMANWPAAEGRPAAANPPASAPAPVASTRTPNNLYFPSSASIPPVNIMTAEPPAQRQPDTTGAADTATPTPPRKPPQTAPTAPRPPPAASASPPAPAANAPARAVPMQIAPNPQ